MTKRTRIGLRLEAGSVLHADESGKAIKAVFILASGFFARKGTLTQWKTPIFDGIAERGNVLSVFMPHGDKETEAAKSNAEDKGAKSKERNYVAKSE